MASKGSQIGQNMQLLGTYVERIAYIQRYPVLGNPLHIGDMQMRLFGHFDRLHRPKNARPKKEEQKEVYLIFLDSLLDHMVRMQR